MKTVLNWSSGKDAALAYNILSHQQEYQVTHLLTTVSAELDRIVMHGVRERLLDIQAERIGLPVTKIKLPASPDHEVYSQSMLHAMNELRAEGVVASAFGDIFLEDLRRYREEQLQLVDMQAIFPLWKMDTLQLISILEKEGIEAMIVCVNEKYLGKEFLGRKIDSSFLNDLPGNVDPCGENGEFHTFVYNAPYFSAQIPIIKKEVVYRKYPSHDGNNKWDTGFYFLDIDAD